MVEVVLFSAVGVGLLVAASLFGRAVFDNPRGDFETGFAIWAGGVYVRLVHAVRLRGRQRLAEADALVGEPLIVVCNHTAGIDPVLVQATFPFFIRWMMAQDMREPVLEWFWRFWEVIFVDRAARDSRGVRTALRHLKAGGTIGIFPEGALERPPRQVLPFQAGVGMLIRRSGAKVLTVTIDGTPQVDPAWGSLWRFSRSIVHVREIVDYSESGLSAEEIANDLRGRFVAYLNWPTNDVVPALDDPQHGSLYGRPLPAT